MTKYTAEHFDRDPTDELPVLTAAVMPEQGTEQDLENTVSADDTGEHTAAFGTLVPDTLPAAPRAQTASIDLSNVTALEAEVERWSARCRSAEERLAEEELRLADLDSTVASTRRLLVEQRMTAERVAAELKERSDALEASVAENTRLREQLERAGAQRATQAAAAESERSAALGQSNDLQRLLEDHAALTAYVGNRKQWWEKAQAEIAALATKVVTLEDELARGNERLARAETLTESESRRAAEFRDQAADLARQLRERVEMGPSPPAPAAAPGSMDRDGEDSGAGSAGRSTSDANTLAPAEPTPPAVERRAPEGAEFAAQLEAEIEYKRQQVAAQLIELHVRDARLQTATHDLEHVRRELEHTRAALETARTELARVESVAADKEQALAARDSTIAALQAELQLRLGALEKLNALDLSLQGLDNKIAERLGVVTGDDDATVPALLCLTGDAPPRVALRRTTTFGRAPHCDVQILTHYVSREHARIVIVPEGAVIEDLGSRNGVFVNAVKVERQRLRRGDLIRIGETQFRYFESMAH